MKTLINLSSRALVAIWLLAGAAVLQAETKMTNLEIVKSTYEGDNAQENAANLARFVAPELEWTEAAGFPYAGTYHGFAEVEQQVFKRLAAEWIDYRFDVEGHVASGSNVVAYGTYHGQHATSGKTFSARVAHLWTLRDGAIVRFEQFVDSLPVVQAQN